MWEKAHDIHDAVNEALLRVGDCRKISHTSPSNSISALATPTKLVFSACAGFGSGCKRPLRHYNRKLPTFQTIAFGGNAVIWNRVAFETPAIPAKAGTQSLTSHFEWLAIPAFAGMTFPGNARVSSNDTSSHQVVWRQVVFDVEAMLN